MTEGGHELGEVSADELGGARRIQIAGITPHPTVAFMGTRRSISARGSRHMVSRSGCPPAMAPIRGNLEGKVTPDAMARLVGLGTRTDTTP